jgi:hypothetical protein
MELLHSKPAASIGGLFTGHSNGNLTPPQERCSASTFFRSQCEQSAAVCGHYSLSVQIGSPLVQCIKIGVMHQSAHGGQGLDLPFDATTYEGARGDVVYMAHGARFLS